MYSTVPVYTVPAPHVPHVYKKKYIQQEIVTHVTRTTCISLIYYVLKIYTQYCQVLLQLLYTCTGTGTMLVSLISHVGSSRKRSNDNGMCIMYADEMMNDEKILQDRYIQVF